MEEGFELPVRYNGKEMIFHARLITFGYIYKIEVDIGGTPVFFERDEERNWRVLTDSDTISGKKIDSGLLSSISITIDELLKS